MKKVMEIEDKIQCKNRFLWHHKLNIVATSLVLIMVGLLSLLRNIGWMNDEVFRMIVSWKTLLIYIGLVQLLKRRLFSGLALVILGVYFLLPSAMGLREIWPILLIVAGVAILFRLHHPHHAWRRMWKHPCFPPPPSHRPTGSATTENGFVQCKTSFGDAKHIVLDPVFRGASLETSFGFISLDLVHTSLEADKTYIDVDTTFGGVELLLPPSWNIVLEADCTFGSCTDNRLETQTTDEQHVLIVRGDVTFGSIEIKG